MAETVEDSRASGAQSKAEGLSPRLQCRTPKVDGLLLCAVAPAQFSSSPRVVVTLAVSSPSFDTASELLTDRWIPADQALRGLRTHRAARLDD